MKQAVRNMKLKRKNKVPGASNAIQNATDIEIGPEETNHHPQQTGEEGRGTLHMPANKQQRDMRSENATDASITVSSL
jgi:hypothetical protein